MIQLFKNEYWSKSTAFLLPLTGLKKPNFPEVIITGYAFYKNYSIYNNQFIVNIKYTEENLYDIYYKDQVSKIYPKAALMEIYKIDEDNNVFIFDFTYWYKDLDKFLTGKYSKFSDEAKDIIVNFHLNKGNDIPVHIYSVLFPHEELPILDDMSGLEYACEHYNLDSEYMHKLGEIGSLYNKEKEILLINN